MIGKLDMKMKYSIQITSFNKYVINNDVTNYREEIYISNIVYI